MLKGRKLLNIWAKWASVRYGTEYPSRSMLIQGADVISKPQRYLDSEAEKIDVVVNRLQNRDKIAFAIVKMYFILKMELVEIARKLKLSLSSVKNKLREAYCFVEGGYEFINRK